MQHDRHAARYVSKLSNKLRRRIDAFSTRGRMSGSQGRALHFRWPSRTMSSRRISSCSACAPPPPPSC